MVRKNHLESSSLMEWLIDLGFYSMDVLGLPSLFEFLYTLACPKVRLLNEEEKKYVSKYFRNKVNVSNVRICPNMPSSFMKRTMAFVTFNTIHFNERISVPVFIHEMVHIWQYQKFGSVYIYRSLQAQNSKEGYDYGGLESLYNKMLSNYTFTAFNFEQQGEIFEDYCRLKEGDSIENPLAFASYEYFIGQVRDVESA